MVKIVFELNLDDEAETLLQAATRVAHNAMALAQSVQSDIALPQNDEQVVSHETFLHEHNMIVLMEAGPRANIGQSLPVDTSNVTLRIYMQPGSIYNESHMAKSGYGVHSRVEMHGDEITKVTPGEEMGVPSGQARH